MSTVYFPYKNSTKSSNKEKLQMYNFDKEAMYWKK